MLSKMKKKYNNWGIDMGGLSTNDPIRYRKIYGVLSGKYNVKKDLLDVVETVPLESVHNLADKGPTPEDTACLSELKVAVTEVLSTLTPREEKVLRLRFGIGELTDHTLEDVGAKFSVTRERMRQIEAKALRKLKHPSRYKELVGFLDAA